MYLPVSVNQRDCLNFPNANDKHAGVFTRQQPEVEEVDVGVELFDANGRLVRSGRRTEANISEGDYFYMIK